MYHIHLICLGRTKEAWLKEAFYEYQRRLTSRASLTIHLVSDDQQLLTRLTIYRRVLVLDPQGERLNSPAFSKKIHQELDLGGAHLAIGIGGADGLPNAIREKYPLISLSELTFPHQLARVIVIEQLYRAFAIAEGRPYHR